MPCQQLTDNPNCNGIVNKHVCAISSTFDLKKVPSTWQKSPFTDPRKGGLFSGGNTD